MGATLRIFVVKDHEVRKIGKKKYEEFYRHGANNFPEYAGEMLDIAEVVVELVDRRPSRIMKIYGSKMKVNGEGGIDGSHSLEKDNYMPYLMDPPKIESSGSMVDASAVFEMKKLKHGHTFELSNQAIRRIADALGV